MSLPRAPTPPRSRAASRAPPAPEASEETAPWTIYVQQYSSWEEIARLRTLQNEFILPRDMDFFQQLERRIVDLSDTTIQYRVKPRTPLRKLLTALAERLNTPPSRLELHFNGGPVDLQVGPASNGLHDGGTLVFKLSDAT